MLKRHPDLSYALLLLCAFVVSAIFMIVLGSAIQ